MRIRTDSERPRERTKFKERRKALGMSPYAASLAIKKTPSYWGKFERGEFIPAIEAAKKIAQFLTDNKFPTHWTEVVDPELDAEVAA